jgi:polyhydroxyalkanoate synthesis regulator phasin
MDSNTPVPSYVFTTPDPHYINPGTLNATAPVSAFAPAPPSQTGSSASSSFSAFAPSPYAQSGNSTGSNWASLVSTGGSNKKKKMMSDTLPPQWQSFADTLQNKSDGLVILSFSRVVVTQYSVQYATKTIAVNVDEGEFNTEMAKAFGDDIVQTLRAAQGPLPINFPLTNQVGVPSGQIGLKLKISADKLDAFIDARSGGFIQNAAAHLLIVPTCYTPFGDVQTPGLSFKVGRVTVLPSL